MEEVVDCCNCGESTDKQWSQRSGEWGQKPILISLPIITRVTAGAAEDFLALNLNSTTSWRESEAKAVVVQHGGGSWDVGHGLEGGGQIVGQNRGLGGEQLEHAAPEGQEGE